MIEEIEFGMNTYLSDLHFKVYILSDAISYERDTYRILAGFPAHH